MISTEIARGSITRLIGHLRTPLYRNGYALLLSSAVTSGLGFVYWVVAARAYPAEIVGLNSAVIASMSFLAAVAQLNLMSALVRFIPGAGTATGRFVLYTYLISVIMAVFTSLVFVAGLNAWMPSLRFLRSNPFFVLWFMFAVIAWCIFVLQDNVMTGLRQAVWVPAENAFFAAAKIVLLVIFAVVFPRYGIFASWTIPVGATLVAMNLLIFRRLIPQHVRETEHQATPLVAAHVARYVAADYFGYLCAITASTFLPVIVTQFAGATANAYYYLAWQIANFLYLISPNMAASLVVEATNNPAELSVYTHRIFMQTARVVVPLAVIMALGAPYILRIFGDDYAREGAMPLRLLALSAIPWMVNALCIGVSRVQRRMAGVVIVHATLCILVLVLSFVWLGRYGITGVALACLVGETSVAIVVLLTRLRPLWASGREGDGRDRA